MSPFKRYPTLDYLRLLLAASVVFNHFVSGHRVFFHPVPAFLALSGFLVLQSYEASNGWPHFAWKRFLRVTPAFGVALILVALDGGLPEVGQMLRCYFSLGYFESRPDGAVWSLGWEELHYILLAVLFALGAYRSKPAVWCLFFAAILVPYVALDYQHRVGGLVPAFVLARYLPSAFFAGNLVYLYRDRVPRYRWLALAVLVGTALAIDDGNVIHAPWYPYLLPLYALMSISLVAVGISFNPELPRLLDISYGLYLYHLPIAFWFGLRSYTAWDALPVILVVCLFSALYVEQPSLKLKNRPPSLSAWRRRRAEAKARAGLPITKDPTGGEAPEDAHPSLPSAPADTKSKTPASG